MAALRGARKMPAPQAGRRGRAHDPVPAGPPDRPTSPRQRQGRTSFPRRSVAGSNQTEGPKYSRAGLGREAGNTRMGSRNGPTAEGWLLREQREAGRAWATRKQGRLRRRIAPKARFPRWPLRQGHGPGPAKRPSAADGNERSNGRPRRGFRPSHAGRSAARGAFEQAKQVIPRSLAGKLEGSGPAPKHVCPGPRPQAPGKSNDERACWAVGARSANERPATRKQRGNRPGLETTGPAGRGRTISWCRNTKQG